VRTLGGGEPAQTGAEPAETEQSRDEVKNELF
jgi:hypothetical protein